MSRRLRSIVAILLVCAPVALSACGGGGSTKPGYCTDRAALEQSVKSLTRLKPSEGLSGLQASLQTIQDEVNRLVASAKSDFPSETSAIRSSFTALATDVRALPSSPSASQLASVAADAASAVSAIRGFVSATKSQCD